jgi:hypothetical protein
MASWFSIDDGDFQADGGFQDVVEFREMWMMIDILNTD